MKRLFFLLLAAGMLSSVQTMAQSKNMVSIQYSMGFGSGDVKSFVSSASLRGGSLGYRYLVQPNVGLGVDISWNNFYERRAFDTYTSGTTSLSGVQYRYGNFVPLCAAGNYYFSPGEKLNPFIGLGVGTMYVKRKTDMGLYTLTNDAWAFLLRPEVGVLVQASPGMYIILAGRYNGGFSTSEFPAQSYFNFNVGLVFN
jgi:opacity protein-like surface antigen